MIGNSSIAFAWLDQDVAATLLDGRSGQPLAPMFAPTGRAVEVNGGYRLSGRWNYVTGSPHATMIVLGFIVVKPEMGAQTAVVDPMIRWGVVSAADVTIEATWRGAAGMCGSGSHDLTAKDVFVPTEHTLTPFIEDPRVEGPLYRTPFFKGTPLLTGVPLGVARRALDEINTLCRNKFREDAAVVEDADVQITLAQAEAALRASRSFVLDSLERLWADVQAGEPSLERETEFALAAQNAMRSAVHAVNLAFEIAGVSASKTGSVIQRCWRDVNVMSQHVARPLGHAGVKPAKLCWGRSPIFPISSAEEGLRVRCNPMKTPSAGDGTPWTRTVSDKPAKWPATAQCASCTPAAPASTRITYACRTSRNTSPWSISTLSAPERATSFQELDISYPPTLTISTPYLITSHNQSR